MPLERGEAAVEIGHGLDAAKIVFKRDMLVGRVRVLVGQPKAEEHARHLKRVVHLRHKGNRPTLANENGTLAEAFFKRGVRHLEKWMRVRRHPGLARAQYLE